MDPNIDEYVRANRDRYTHEAIREQLIAAGHDPATVDAALERAATPARQATSGLASLSTGLYLTGAALGFLGWLAALGFSSSFNLPVAILFFAATYLGIGYLLTRLIRWSTGKWQIRGIWAGLLGLVLFPIFGALALGTCLGSFAIGNAIR